MNSQTSDVITVSLPVLYELSGVVIINSEVDIIGTNDDELFARNKLSRAH